MDGYDSDIPERKPCKSKVSCRIDFRFHCYNGTRPSESVPAGSQLADDELFARPPDVRTPKVPVSQDQTTTVLFFRYRYMVLKFQDHTMTGLCPVLGGHCLVLKFQDQRTTK